MLKNPRAVSWTPTIPSVYEDINGKRWCPDISDIDQLYPASGPSYWPHTSASDWLSVSTLTGHPDIRAE